MLTNTSSTQPLCIRPKPRQRGVALIVVLLFLLAITGLTVWAARQSMLGEGMARNQLDQEIARQAAESALRDAERDLARITPAVLTNASCSRGRSDILIPAQMAVGNCTMGMCQRDDATYPRQSNWDAGSSDSGSGIEVWWPVSKGGAWNNNIEDEKPNPGPDSGRCNFIGAVPLGTFTGITAIRGVKYQPEYIIEYVGKRYSPVLKRNAFTFRITARGFGYTERTQVVLQTYFSPLYE